MVEITTLEEMLQSLKENTEAELGSQGLGTWSIGASGQDFTELLQSYSIDDLKELRDEVMEGTKVELTIDLSDALSDYLNEVIDKAEESEYLDNLDDDEDEEKLDYDDEEDYGKDEDEDY